MYLPGLASSRHLRKGKRHFDPTGFFTARAQRVFGVVRVVTALIDGVHPYTPAAGQRSLQGYLFMLVCDASSRDQECCINGGGVSDHKTLCARM